MELALDIFRTDDFVATEMTEMVGDIDTVPNQLATMGIFEDEYLRTTTVTLVAKDNLLERVATSERGAPEQLKGRSGRTLRQLEGPRLAQRDRINSKEVENLLNPMLPTATRLDNAMELVAERQKALKDDDENTREYHRFGALSGIILDADGTTEVADFYEEFGIAQPAAIELDLATITADDLRGDIDETIIMPMRRILKGRLTPNTRYQALVSDEFWSKLIRHPGVQRIWELQESKVDMLGESMAWKSLTFGGVTWHHYYGSDDETLQVPAGQAKVFPTGAKDVFKAYHFPGESFTEVNEKAKDIYSVVSPDNRPNMFEWVDIYVRSYVLYACLAPQALMTLELP